MMPKVDLSSAAARPAPLEHAPDAPVEELEEVAVEDDAGRIAMTPFDDELP